MKKTLTIIGMFALLATIGGCGSTQYYADTPAFYPQRTMSYSYIPPVTPYAVTSYALDVARGGYQYGGNGYGNGYGNHYGGSNYYGGYGRGSGMGGSYGNYGGYGTGSMMGGGGH